MNAPLLQPFSVVMVGTDPAIVGTPNANGVKPGCGVLKGKGVLLPTTINVAGADSVGVAGKAVLVGIGVGELANATWVKT